MGPPAAFAASLSLSCQPHLRPRARPGPLSASGNPSSPSLGPAGSSRFSVLYVRPVSSPLQPRPPCVWTMVRDGLPTLGSNGPNCGVFVPGCGTLLIPSHFLERVFAKQKQPRLRCVISCHGAITGFDLNRTKPEGSGGSSQRLYFRVRVRKV